MGEFASYPHGTPSWVDLGTTDLAAAREFYGRLLGWLYEVGPPETDHYTMCRLRDRNVAGTYTLMPELTARGVSPNWTTYIDVDSVDADRRGRRGGPAAADRRHGPGTRSWRATRPARRSGAGSRATTSERSLRTSPAR